MFRRQEIEHRRRMPPRAGKLEQFWACRKAISVIMRFCEAMETVSSPFASMGMGRAIGAGIEVAWPAPRLQWGRRNVLAELSYQLHADRGNGCYGRATTPLSVHALGQTCPNSPCPL
jgi:hypothetical protein